MSSVEKITILKIRISEEIMDNKSLNRILELAGQPLVEEINIQLNERDHLLKILTRKFPDSFFKKGEEFSKSGEFDNTIWTGTSDNNSLFDYYSEKRVNKRLQRILDKYEWHADFYDPGTVFLRKK
jgi:predicted alpha/beta-fold hydrolase